MTEGKGYFKASASASPFIGEVGEMEEVAEVVIEFVCLKNELPLLKQVLAENHPYEEVAVNVFPLLDF